MVQACLVFSLLALCFFACFQQFFTPQVFLASFPSEIAKLDSLKLDLNDSSFGELAQVPGVGKSIASEIINYRKAFGGFKTLDEIEKLFPLSAILPVAFLSSINIDDLLPAQEIGL